MIRIRADMVDFEMDMTGHAAAERDPKDVDLVCCAASTLAYQLLNSIERWDSEHEGLNKLETQISPGHMHIRAKAKEWARPPIKDRFGYWLEGVRMLAEEYPKYIEIVEE